MSKQQIKNQLFEEFEYKEKAGSAWSHNYLNQKPWHPMSYPNQRRKWIAEQMHGLQGKRKTEIEREFEKEQEFFKQSALLSKQKRDKAAAQQAVSFMYTKPPGYNAESARAAELEDEKRKLELEHGAPEDDEAQGVGGKALVPVDEALVLAKSGPMGGATPAEDADKKKKVVRRDVFGKRIVTEEDYEQLKNAPRMDTGFIGRARPFGIELKNVRCGRCGAMGHQSGERECPLKDAVTENEVKRQEREDPMSLLLLHNRPELKWQPKQSLGGISPPRGGFKPDDPNQQILPPDEEDEEEAGGSLDEYGGPKDEETVAGVSKSVLESLSKKQRKELLKALKKQSRKQRDGKHSDSKMRRKKRQQSDSDESTDQEKRGRERRSEGSEGRSQKDRREKRREDREGGGMREEKGKWQLMDGGADDGKKGKRRREVSEDRSECGGRSRRRREPREGEVENRRREEWTRYSMDDSADEHKKGLSRRKI